MPGGPLPGYGSAMRTLLAALVLAAGCTGPRPCVKQCKDDQAFFEECWSDFEAVGIQLTCYDKLDDMAAALTEAGSDEAAVALVYQEWRSAGRTRACKSAAELTEQCIALTEATFDGLDKDGRRAARDECDPDEDDTAAVPDARRQAIEDGDCEAFIVALGL